MSISPEPEDKQSSAYLVQGSPQQEEILRLHRQDRWITTSMGGVLAELPEPVNLRRVLDIGCGTGGWLLNVASQYPEITLLLGVDINQHMVQFARAQTKTQHLEGRVEFHVMDVLSRLEFPNNYFDLVNMRFASSYLRAQAWPAFLQACCRICRPGGIVRVTETHLTPDTTSPTLLRLVQLQQEALANAGYLFTPTGASLVEALPELFEQGGFQHIQTRSYSLETRADTSTWQLAFDALSFLFRTSLPFLQTWTTVPADYETIYQQMLKDLQQPDYHSTSHLFTTWGTTPAQ